MIYLLSPPGLIASLIEPFRKSIIAIESVTGPLARFFSFLLGLPRRVAEPRT